MNDNETHTPSTEIADNCGPMRTKSGQGIEIIGSPVWNGIGEPGSVLTFECASQRQAIDHLCMKVFGARPVYPQLPEPALPSYRDLPINDLKRQLAAAQQLAEANVMRAYDTAIQLAECRRERDRLAACLDHLQETDWFREGVSGREVVCGLDPDKVRSALAFMDGQQIEEGDF